MRGKSKTVSRAVPIAAVAALHVLAPKASAQSAGGWSLPPAPTSSSAPAAQGPVDAQNPLVHPESPDAARSASPTPPTINAPPPPPASVVPRPAATPRPVASAPPTPARPTPAPQALPATAAAGQPTPAPTIAPPAETPAAVPAAPVSGGDTGWPLWWWAIPATFAAAAIGFLLRRRHGTPAEQPWEEPRYEPVETVPPEPGEEKARAPLPGPAFTPAPVKSPEPLHARAHVEFHPETIRLSLVYATLQYHLLLTARTDIPAGKLLGDMISAHGSLPQAMQLEPPPEALGVLRAIPPMSPGQVLEVKGDLRLPLNAIRPVQRGGASFMVPLVRLALLGNEAAAPHLELGCVFTIGVPGGGPALAPLRLDTGPREFTSLAAREIDAARRGVLLALDPARAAG